MNYQGILDYLYNTLPMFSRMGSAAFKKDLTNTNLLCKHLGDPHKKFKTIHVGGTNGKGSVSHMLAAVLQTSGYKTGLYTSPHLKDFRERIRVDGKMCEEDFVVQFVERIKPAIDEIQPSFFEITVAMAFEYFAQQKVDVAVIEVGLGGRLDSTNVITPELSIITSIGYDHMQMLGNTLKEIAGEKAGIIKENIPVIIGEKNIETEEVFKQQAISKNSKIYFAEDCFKVKDFEIDPEFLQIEIEDLLDKKSMQYKLDLQGIYQTKNVASALTAIKVLQERGWKIKEEDVSQALRQTKELNHLKGRWDVIHREPTIVLEVAHNEDGIKQMLNHLQYLKFSNLHLIIGMVKDKDVEKVISLLPKNANYYFTQADIPRALDKESLQRDASKYDLKGNVYNNVNEALTEAKRNALPTDLIIVCGSIFLVAEVDEAVLQTSII